MEGHGVLMDIILPDYPEPPVPWPYVGVYVTDLDSVGHALNYILSRSEDTALAPPPSNTGAQTAIAIKSQSEAGKGTV